MGEMVGTRNKKPLIRMTEKDRQHLTTNDGDTNSADESVYKDRGTTPVVGDSQLAVTGLGHQCRGFHKDNPKRKHK